MNSATSLNDARELGLRVVSVPVEWHDEGQSKVRVPRAVLSSLLDLARILWWRRDARVAGAVGESDQSSRRSERPAR